MYLLHFEGNEIFSWGTGENGRLGTVSSDQGRGPGGMCLPRPQAIFGSLHLVSDVTCRHWHTMVVAGKHTSKHKMLNQCWFGSGST